jgi:hypothetical protein
VPDKASPAAAPEADDVLRPVQRFLAVLNAHLGRDSAGIDAVLKSAAVWRGFTLAFKVMKPASKAARTVQTRLLELLEAPSGARVLTGWLLLRHAGAESLEAFGLDCTLRRVLKEDLVGESSQHLDQLLRALLAWDGPDDSGPANAMVRAFSCPACRDFMLIHDSDGVEWFNKERFEELAEWFAVIGLVKLALKRPAGRTVSAWLSVAGRELDASTALAAHAGYRSSLFQQLLEPPAKAGAGFPAKRDKGKGADVQRDARAHTPKTPDDTLPR